MCGIAGLWTLSSEVEIEAALRASAAIAHRGPDDEGYSFITRASGLSSSYRGPSSPAELHDVLPPVDSAHLASQRSDLALIHRRFAIIAPTPAGHQPFW